jgi:tetratricopeptide (TPR) repeat protein
LSVRAGERARGPDDALAHALIAILLAAVVFRGGVTGAASASLGLAIAGLGACALLIRNLTPVSPGALCLAMAWCAVALGSTLWSVEPDASLDAAAATFASALVFLLGASLLGPTQRERFLVQFSVLGAIVAVIAIALAGPGQRASLPFGNANHLGSWLLLPGSVAFGHLLFTNVTRRGRRESAVLWFGVLGAIGAALAVSESLGAALAALGAAVGIAALRWTGGPLVVGGLIAGAALLCIMPPLVPELLPMYEDAGESSAGFRWGVYAASAKAAWDAAPLGVGAGGFAPAFAAYRPVGLPYAVGYAHSEPLHGLTELGLPFLLLAGLTAGLASRRAARRLGPRAPHAARCGAGALLALAMHSLIDFPLHVPALALAGAALAGLTWRALDLAPPRPAGVGGQSTRICVGLLSLALAVLAGTQAVAVRAGDRAHARLASGDFESADRALRPGLVVRPGRPELLALAADAAEGAFRLGGGGPPALARALEARTRAAHAAPRRAAAWVGLAKTRALAGDLAGALEEADRAVRVDPRSPVARLFKVRLLVALDRDKRAVSELRDAIECHPSAAAQMLEALFRESKDPSLVRAAVPDLAGPRLQAGRMLVAAGHPRAGAEELEAALELGPAEPRTALASARAFVRAGDTDAAIAVLKHTLARLPEEPALSAELAQLEATRATTPSGPLGGTS